jgi:predicted acyltransferase
VAGARLHGLRRRCGALVYGHLWGWEKLGAFQLPVIKKIWTSSFVLVAGGWSCMFLASFYAIIDCLRLRRWGFLFMLIGLNPLTLYFLGGSGLLSFYKITDFFFGFAINQASKNMAKFYESLAVMAVQFAFLFWLYRRKIFWRV